MCLDDTFVQYVHAAAMHNYEMRHGDLINSHNTRAYKVSKTLMRVQYIRRLICALLGDGTFRNGYVAVMRQFGVSNGTF